MYTLKSFSAAKIVGRTPWSAAGPLAGSSVADLADEGVGRGPGGPPHKRQSRLFGCGSAALWGGQSWRQAGFLAGFFLLATLLTAVIAPSAWQHRKPIPLTPSDALAVVKLDREVYIGARPDLADLRVLRDGEETPYVLEALTAASQTLERPADITDQSVAPSEGLQFTLHLTARAQHNHVRLETSERNFRQAVRIETSEDAKRWSVARTDGAIFDFSQGDRQLSALTVYYPVSTRPFLRVTVRGWTKVTAVTAAYVDFQEERPASHETLATLTPQIADDPKTQSTLLTLDTGAEGLPVDRIRIETPSPSFHRAVDVESSSDGTEWAYVTQGVIARLAGEETLLISIPETRHRHLRLRVYNRDDRPLSFGQVRLDGLIRRIKFIASTKSTYWLYYGNSDARTPVYDLPILLSRRENIEQSEWTAGPREANPDYRPPAKPEKPWSERHPAILYTVLGAAVLGLGAATLRFALKLRQP